jgi:nitrilase
MKLASIQMVSSSALESNLKKAQQLIEQAAMAGAKLIVLPEYFCLLGQTDRQKLTIQEPFWYWPHTRLFSHAC